MLPTLRAGDCLVVRRGGGVRPGDLVVARFHARPGLLVVKRAVCPVAGGWELGSDNPAVAGHGLTSGPGDVEAVVRWRYWPWPPTRLAGTDPESPA